MKSTLTLSTIVALSALMGCGAPGRPEGTSTGGNASNGGSTASGGSAGSGGAGSGGVTSAGGQGGSTVADSGGTTTATGVGGAGDAGGATASGGATGRGGSAGSGGSTSAGGATSSGGATASGGVTGQGGATAKGGSTGLGGAAGSGGATAAGGSSSPGGATGTGGSSSPGGTTGNPGPCDIYQSASTPCVAAHSTVRALYAAYTGPLYQLRRKSDGTTKDVPALTAGGFVDIGVQDTFCTGTTCTISILYDQSPNKNNLTKAPVATWLKSGANEADASLAKITVGGHVAHGIYVKNSNNPATDVGYRCNTAKGLAKGDEAESMYMVLDGTRSSSICCFDYGNVGTTSTDEGDATMEAIYWGTSVQFAGSTGVGSGPWVCADLENGMFAGDSKAIASPVTTTNTTISGWSYVTAVLKGPSGNAMGIKAGNAQSGKLETKFNGKRPPGYSPMKKVGAIVLGTGGDGSSYGVGTFFEGCITSGNPPDATDDAIHANIVAAGYGK
jgi:hypothetical protein